jgi:hypothetical protein
MEEVRAGFKRCSRCGKVKSFFEFHRDKTKKDGKQFFCKTCKSEIYKEWQKNLTKERKTKRTKESMERCSRNLAAWKPIIRKMYNIKKEFTCEVCGVTLKFPEYGNGINNRIKTIQFDHKKNDVTIKGSPSNWLAGHFPTPKNIELFKSCDFGILCGKCNIHLGNPENRKEKLVQEYRYVFGSLPGTKENAIDNFILIN